MLNETERLGSIGNVAAVKTREDPFSIVHDSNSEQTLKTSDLTGNKES